MKSTFQKFNFIATLTWLIASTNFAFATCTKPVGSFVGAGAGITLTPYPNATISGGNTPSFSVVFNSNGTGTFSDAGKNGSGIQYNLSYTFTSVNNNFNSTTCRGVLALTNGPTYMYTSSGGGNKVTFIPYSNDGMSGNFYVVTEKM